jgi:beta-xylosidase
MRSLALAGLALLVCGGESVRAGLLDRLREAIDPAPATLWQPDLGDGTYKNPVLFADYSDPDVVRVGDNFYLTASSFQYVPGLPILHSTDLVNWTLVGHAAPRLPARFDAVHHSDGLWAPSIRWHDGWFWIFVGDPDLGILMTKARKPEGPWTPLHLVKAGKGLIDTCPLWDDDGRAWLVHAWAGSRAGINSILTVHEMSPDGTRLLDEGRTAFDGRNGVQPTIEGPKFYKRDGWYWIFAPAGGVEGGWQLALRSKTPQGPYEARRVLDQGTTAINGPHQGGWVELANGENWFLHFQQRNPYGRIVHLEPMTWKNGWPVIGADPDGHGIGEPVSQFRKPDVPKKSAPQVPQTSDEFESPALGLQWQWPANPRAEWSSLADRPGWLRLAAAPAPNAPNLWPAPNLLTQKFPAPAFRATAKLELSADAPSDTRAGLLVFGRSYAGLVVSRRREGLEIGRIRCSFADDGQPEMTEATARATAGPIWLRVFVRPEGCCVFSYSTDGEHFTELGAPFQARGETWVGAKLALFCSGRAGHADFDWVRVE